jgi:hypothetical protein
MNGRFTLPSDPDHGMKFDLFTKNLLDSAGGDVMFAIASGSGQTFHSANTQYTDTWLGSSSLFAVQNTGRSHWIILYLENGAAKEWHFRRVNADLTSAQIERIDQCGRHFHKYFAPDYAANHTTNALAYVPPDGYERYSVVKGDGSEWHDDGTITPKQLRVAFPTNPLDGSLFELHSNIHKDTSTQAFVVQLSWPGPDSANMPSGRYLVSDGTVYQISNPVTIVCAANTGHTRRDYYRFNLTSNSVGFWSRFVDSN